MDNGLHGEFSLVYDGEGVPTVQQFTADNLMTGFPYRFYVKALNYVGESAASVTTQIFACAKPSGVPAPSKVTVSKTSVSIKWS